MRYEKEVDKVRSFGHIDCGSSNFRGFEGLEEYLKELGVRKTAKGSVRLISDPFWREAPGPDSPYSDILDWEISKRVRKIE
jgi:hypothetical protein